MNIHATVSETAKTSGPDRLPVPDDFAEHAPTESGRQLRARYKVGEKTIRRWREMAGIPIVDHAERCRRGAEARWGRPGGLVKDMPPPNDFADFAKRHVNKELAARYNVSEGTISRWRKETGTSSSIVGYRTAPLPKAGVPPIAAGTASEAAQWLRTPEGGSHVPVFHRIIEGKEFKGQYVVGRNVMTEDQVVEYARSRGFKTGAEQLAAFDKYD